MVLYPETQWTNTFHLRAKVMTLLRSYIHHICVNVTKETNAEVWGKLRRKKQR